MTRLRIKLGGDPIDGWVHVKDVQEPLEYQNGTVDQMLAVHVVQRMTRWQTIAKMKHWYDKLSDRGLLAIEMPDRDKAFALHALGNSGPHVETPLGPMNVGTLAIYGCQIEPDEGNRYLWSVSEFLKIANDVGFFVREASHDAKFNRKGLDMWFIGEKII